MRIEIDLPDDDPWLQWVLDKHHEHGLRLCNDVACVRITSWRVHTDPRAVPAAVPADDGFAPLFTTEETHA